MDLKELISIKMTFCTTQYITLLWVNLWNSSATRFFSSGHIYLNIISRSYPFVGLCKTESEHKMNLKYQQFINNLKSCSSIDHFEHSLF